jgi:hypothetical protein
MWLSLALACVTPTTGWVLEVRGAALDPTWAPLEDVTISLLTADGAWMGTATTDSDGLWSLPVLFEDAGQIPVQVHADRGGREPGVLHTTLLLRGLPDPIPLRVGPGQQLAMATVHVPPLVLAREGDGVGSGSVLDATTGERIPRLQLSLHRGWNAPADAAIVAWGSTDGDGDFSLALPAGTYTAHAEAQAGYARTVFPIVVDPDEVLYQRGYAVPPPGEPELRAALAWDGASAALDLHMTGPMAGAEGDNGRYNVYEQAPVFPVSGDPVAELDFTAAGSEAISVHEHLTEGLYRLSAHDAGNAAESDGSDALSRSAALAWLWWEEEVWLETAPYAVDGTVWRALELEVSDGTLIRLHAFDDSASGDDLKVF